MRKNLSFRAVMLLSIVGALGVGALFSGSALFAAGPAEKCGYYINSNGQQIPSPCGNWRNDPTPPGGATARCRDGSWSWSRHPYSSGTCNYHGGVENYR
jgi:Protein of unknown function (DUF3761)